MRLVSKVQGLASGWTRTGKAGSCPSCSHSSTRSNNWPCSIARATSGLARRARALLADQTDRSQADEFAIPQMSGQVYYALSGSSRRGEPLITIAIPLLHARTGRRDAVFIAEVRMKTIWELIAAVQVSPGQTAYIVDTQQWVVAHRNPSVVLRSMCFAVPSQDGIQPGLSQSTVVLAVHTVRFGETGFTSVVVAGIVLSLSPGPLPARYASR